MNNNNASRVNGLVLGVAALLLGHAGSANALGYTEPDFNATYQAGLACGGFDLTISGWYDGRYPKELKSNSGLILNIPAGLGSTLIFKNETTGSTFSLKPAKSSIHTTYKQDLSQTVDLNGYNVVILFPTGSQPGPSTTLYIGHVIVSVDTQGNWTTQHGSGDVTDICAAVSN